MATPTIPAGQSAEQDPESRWHALQERCIAMTGKTLFDLDADETMRVVNLLSTDDRAFALRYLGRSPLAATNESKDSPMPKKARRRKREPSEERMTLPEAFALGDDRDDERALRACALLLDWASEGGNDKIDGFLAVGIARALDVAAYKMDRHRRHRQFEEVERGT